MSATLPRPDTTPRDPDAFRDALAELVGIGMHVARMVGRAAEAEAALAEAAAQAGIADDVSSMATSLAEAREQDIAFAAACEARRDVVARTEAVVGAFNQVSRAIRRTVMLAERLDQGWATRRRADDRHEMAKRQIARGVEDAIERAGVGEAGREAQGDRAEQLTDALAERLDAMDDIGSRPAEEVIAEICRDLGVDPVRMRLQAGDLAPAGVERRGFLRALPSVVADRAGHEGGSAVGTRGPAPPPSALPPPSPGVGEADELGVSAAQGRGRAAPAPAGRGSG